jgi:hypothetical protein
MQSTSPRAQERRHFRGVVLLPDRFAWSAMLWGPSARGYRTGHNRPPQAGLIDAADIMVSVPCNPGLFSRSPGKRQNALQLDASR